jgi:hypothetical protein
MGERGREVFESEAGATERSVQTVLEVLRPVLNPAHTEARG